MKTITLSEDFAIPGTDVILEAGDQIRILQEDNFNNILTPEYLSIARKVGSGLGEKLDWDIYAAEAFCLYLLEDVNERNHVLDAVADIFMKKR